ncbi:iron-siderophore ABC transporter substrate-binding protein [Leptolyngbya sp. AN03gr2]|uniref:iron-siderophore ABC transporter substrate-binding protein n=1 Tax=unclassified Leptolyngbya TaxID=2650499 RepID=UPI003D32042C
MKFSLIRLAFQLLLGVLTIVILVACHNLGDTPVTSLKPQLENCRTVKHIMGTACIPRSPQRVIALREDTLANSLALGIKPIASVFEPSYPLPAYLQQKIKGIVSVGKTDAPNLERILELKPDLILANSYYSARIYKQLSQIAPTVTLNVPFPPPSWKQQLEELAKVLGREEVGQQLINQYQQRIENLKQKLGNRRRTINVSIASTTSAYGLWVNGEKHFSGEVLRDLEVQRPPIQRGDFFYIDNISEENVLDIDGDILFFVVFGTAEDLKTVEKLKQNPLWKKLSAVQRAQVYSVGGHWSNADVFAINAILDDLSEYLVDSSKS